MDEKEGELLQELQKENRWWSSREVPKELARRFKRSDYYKYKEFLIEEGSADIIIGPRRIGKSTVIYQLIDYLIKERGINPNRILFLSLERAFLGVVKNPIQSSLNIFEENILKEVLSEVSEPVYIFLDEASRREDWALIVKEHLDRKHRMKFFITGSSSPALFQRSSESLVGRHRKRLMLTLKFKDVVRMKDEEDINKLLLGTRGKELRNLFLDAVMQKKPEIFFDIIRDTIISCGAEGETKLQLQLNNYLLRGGYPEFYDKKTDWKNSSKIMREAYFESILGYDMVRVFKSRNPEKIKQLYIFLSLATSDQCSISKLCNDIGLSRGALEEYLSQLEQTYLIRTVRLYRKNPRKISTDRKKIYIGDVGIRNAVLDVNEYEIMKTQLSGHLAETVAQDHTLRLKFCLEPNKPCELYFWKDKTGKEVDIIMRVGETVIPIEIKYRNTIKSVDIKPLKNAISEFNSPFGLLITKNSFQYKDNIISIPLWLYLLMC